MKIKRFIRGIAQTIGLLNVQSFRRIIYSNIIIRHCILDMCVMRKT